MVARFAGRGGRETVDGLGKDARTRGLAYSARAAEQVAVGQSTRGDGIFERCGEGFLAYYAVKCRWAIFSRRYYIVVHVINLTCHKFTKSI